MSATAIPVYLLARQLVSPRAAVLAALGALCTPALFYASFLIPEVLASIQHDAIQILSK